MTFISQSIDFVIFCVEFTIGVSKSDTFKHKTVHIIILLDLMFLGCGI